MAHSCYGYSENLSFSNRSSYSKKMPETSKTGLIPSNKKSSKIKIKEIVTLKMPNVVFPAPFTLRPFAGIYNPYSYGCSILCNHPTDLEAKEIVQKAKDARESLIISILKNNMSVSEGKCLIDLKKQATVKTHRGKTIYKLNSKSIQERDNNQSPEILFPKHNNTDTRPSTSTPMLISASTEISPNLKTRRCFTPDPTSFFPNNQRTLLVLDLRRSQSQETLCLPKNKTTNFDLDSARSESFTSMTQIKKKKVVRNKSAASSLKMQSSEDSGQKVRLRNSSLCKSPSKRILIQDQKNGNSKSYGSSGGSCGEDSEKIIKRRGKKRKGKKSKRNGLKVEKEFKGIPDPNETQVSALVTESQNGSSPRSLSREEISLKDEDVSSKSMMEAHSTQKLSQNSFLNSDILRHFQRELDREVVDAELDCRRKKALAEALRQKANTKTITKRRPKNEEEMKWLKDIFENPGEDSKDWLSIPRVFTRRSARFELPMDSRIIKDLTPYRYVQSFVFPSPARLILYNYVFKLYMEEFEEDEQYERIILGKHVCEGLSKIMGRMLTTDEAENFQKLIGWRNEESLNFRTFTGISAVCERLLSSSFCPNLPKQTEDPRHEVEVADFNTLEGKLNRLKPNKELAKMLRLIRDL